LKGALVYDEYLFEPETINRMVSEYINILEIVAENPELKLSEIDRKLEQFNEQQQQLKQEQYKNSIQQKFDSLRRRALG